MKFAIIAAGEGSRLAEEGIKEPKPLVRVNGEALIDRLIRIFMSHDADEIVVICNDLQPYVMEHLSHIAANGLDGTAVPLRYVVKSTPSSMHSFFEISTYLENSPFVLTTVDTIFREDEFSRYVDYFKSSVTECDGVMGVTDYIDDEKPLYVAVEKKCMCAGEESVITAFLDTCEQPQYISGGIYGLTPKAITTLRGCIQRGESRMRNFQRALLRDDLRLKAYPFSKVLDIDHASDIQKAEDFLK